VELAQEHYERWNGSENFSRGKLASQNVVLNGREWEHVEAMIRRAYLAGHSTGLRTPRAKGQEQKKSYAEGWQQR
jgi:hypothetical protein